jgi:hypothetical protein
MAEDGGVLGNLPNSRPGKRSAKRDAGAARPAKSAAGAASPKAARPRRRTTAVKGGGSDRVVVDRDMRGEVRHGPVPPQNPVPPSASEDPVGAVVRTGASIVGAGVKVAEGITRELFRRLPRP